MAHVHSMKFPFPFLLGAPPPILAISGNIFFRFIDFPGFNIVKYLKITIVVIPYFIVGAGLCYGTYSSLECFKDKSNFYI